MPLSNESCVDKLKNCLEKFENHISVLRSEWSDDVGPFVDSVPSFLKLFQNFLEPLEAYRADLARAYLRLATHQGPWQWLESHFSNVEYLLGRVQREIVNDMSRVIDSGDLNDENWAEKRYQPRIDAHLESILAQAKLNAEILSRDVESHSE